MTEINVPDIGFKIFGAIVLVIILLFFLTWGGLIRCGTIPFWCDVYETVMGSPRVLIVFGDSGLGDPEELRSLLLDPRKVGVSAVDIIHIDRVSSGNLQRYGLVIVEKSREMSMDQLSMFVDFVNGGGRLVWIGDAGTMRPSTELEKIRDSNDPRLDLSNPWVRVRETESEYLVLNFDEFLGLTFLGNYCEIVNCAGENFSVGQIIAEATSSHHLIYGFTSALELRITPERDFGVVSQIPRIANNKIVLSLDQGSIKQGEKLQLQRFLPMISTIGLGERVAYYSYPLEYFCNDNNYPNACTLLLKQMYYGMLGK